MSSEMIHSPYEKSIQFLKDICEMNGIELLKSSTIYKITVRVQGRSGRHYEVVASRPVSLFSQETWQTAVSGAAWKTDFNSENARSYTTSLCLNTHEEKRHLPIGDRLASLVLSLHNDIKLAMDIPLVAQFIICPRDELFDVYSFQDDMVVTQDMIDGQQEFEDDFDDMFDEDEDIDDDFEQDDIVSDLWFSRNQSDQEDSELQSKSWADEIAELVMRQYDRDNDSS